MKAPGIAMGLMVLVAGCDGRKEGPGAEEPGGNGPAVGEAVVGTRTDELVVDQWISMVPDEGMGDWKGVEYGGEGMVAWSEGVLRMDAGAGLTGARWEGDLPELPYEIDLEARKTSGEDFFCGLTVPVGGEGACVTLIVGGWGGGVVGISSIDELDASENETSSYREFDRDRWYRIRMVVRDGSLEAWVGEEKLVDVETKGRRLGLRAGAIEESAPLGVASFETTAEVRGIRWRNLQD